ncbi:MAG TPA: CBASS cGAMP-activated phospholipase [Ignavibacteria bacterium]|nr:CBASS cGAMP-activated phospholipase [Ignavibacteria bacterium]HQY51960.1 CBASS cGAMP-activated phospholipase [Ignavibacteria bacterium]HRB01313.1 CBASS cGAMP-activated phospholipase [Ignavibacteria bacterium]
MKKILTIDGGGIRGVLPARILHEIEKRTKKPISEIFDLIAGTSTGGILALCLTKPKENGKPRYKALDILKLYEDEGKKIFKKSPWKSTMSMGNLVDEKFSIAGIEEVLEVYLGETKLSESLTNLIIPSYELEQRIPFFFKSRKAKESEDYDFKMRDVARATSAAPTYFESLKLRASPPVDYFALIDGGVFANNPSMCAYAEAIKEFGSDEEILLVSLGTGELTRRISYEESKNWGLIGWARPLLDVVFDGVSRTVEYQLCQILNSDPNKKRFYRFQTKLDIGNDNMDDASATNIRVLKLKAEEMINSNKDEFESLCKLL